MPNFNIGANKKSGDNRIRNFATVVYPDSAVEGWQDILSETHVALFISPLHDKDVNPDGEIKKPHWHVLFAFENKKSDEQVQAIIDLIGGVGLERVNSLRGYARYLCHLDNPEKHQYLPADVRSMGGADYFDVIGLPTDRLKAVSEMMDWCEENDCTSLYELNLYAKMHRQDWFRVLSLNATYQMGEHLKSKKWTETERERRG